MKNKLIILAVAILLFGAWHLGRAQSTTPFTVIAGSLTHTSCPTVAASTTQFCFASDGLWQSLNGAAYVQLGTPVAAGVTSWNGLTGAVTYAPPTPPVSSVNGKTGAVVITAATTLQ
jgi:hypothetical protein